MDEKKINWFPGHMNKAIRNAEEKLKLIDLIIEIVDARAPFSSSNPIVNKLALNKLRLVILAKKDLADHKITKQWIQYYQQKNINVLALNLFSKNVTDEVINKIFEVLSDKFNKQKSKGIVNYQAKVMVMGVPNVGKSTFINNVIRKNSAKTGNRPGVTKGQQWIKLNDNIDFLDTPGILWNKIENQQTASILALLGSIKEEVLPIEEITFKGFKYIYNHYFDLINEFYNFGKKQRVINDEEKIYELFNIICKNHNFKVTESIYDIEKAVELVFKDIRDGNIGAISYETPASFEKENNI